MQVSLSKYFPKNTQYFYSFPSGEDSEFFNGVPPWKEELVAGRPLVCAGSNVKVIAFASAREEKIWNILRELGAPLIKQENILYLPNDIKAAVKGKKRNRVIKTALQKIASQRKLVMAQPYLGEMLHDKYQIPPEVTIWCNDKKNMVEYVPPEFLPERFATFASGRDFFASELTPEFPCVVKISSSSSGDGVRICNTQNAYTRAKKKFRRIKGSVFVEEFIDTKYNLGIQFGVPHKKEKPIEIIGINEQLTTEKGEYLGAIVDLKMKFPEAAPAVDLLLTHILPFIRARGWHGMGAFDVLIGKNGQCYFIDSNFRMSAMSAYLCLIANKKIRKSIVTFTGVYRGAEDDFRRDILPIAKNGERRQKMRIISLVVRDGVFQFNAAMFFKEWKDIRPNAKSLLDIGIQSDVLKRVVRRKIRAHVHV